MFASDSLLQCTVHVIFHDIPNNEISSRSCIIVQASKLRNIVSLCIFNQWKWLAIPVLFQKCSWGALLRRVLSHGCYSWVAFFAGLQH